MILGLLREINWYELIISSFLSGVVTVLLLMLFKPKLLLKEIDIIEVVNKENSKSLSILKVEIENASRYSSVTNIKVEIAFVNGKYTYHFLTDRFDFILLPRKSRINISRKSNSRVFRTIDFDPNTYLIMDKSKTEESYQEIFNIIKKPNCIVRIRIHANHGFTNFGKAFEFNYKYDENYGFTNICKRKCLICCTCLNKSNYY